MKHKSYSAGLLFVIVATCISMLACSHGCPSTVNKTTGTDVREIEQYRVSVAMEIARNWRLDNQSAMDKNLVATLVLKVMPDGEIKDVFFVKRSGNSVFDDAAYQAVRKTSPTIPIPESINKAFIELGLRFRPKGVK